MPRSEIATQLLIADNPTWLVRIYGFAWLASLALIVAYGIGVPLVLALAVQFWRRNRRLKREKAELIPALQAEHQKAITREHQAWQTRQTRIRQGQSAPVIEVAS